jgi:hypothetical protein
MGPSKGLEGISKHSRLRTTAVAAFVASGLVLMAMSASASAHETKRISLGIRNSSLTPIRVDICRNRDAREPTARVSACHQITESHVVGSGHVYIVPNSDPVGVTITRDPQCVVGFDPCPDGRTLYFYAQNGGFFYFPFFSTNGHQIALDEPPGHQGITHYYHLGDQQFIHYELRRYADEDRNGENVNLMRIMITKWATQPRCQGNPALPAGGC